MVLLFWQVLGLKLAWRKLERGKVVRWIGAMIQIQPDQKHHEDVYVEDDVVV